MSVYEYEVIAKFLGDAIVFSKPSFSSFMIINLDKTDITGKIAGTIITVITKTSKILRRRFII